VYSKHDTSPDYWRAAAGVCFPGLSLDWLTDEPVRARLVCRTFADAQVKDVIDSPVHLTRNRPRSASCGGYWLVLQIAGNTRYSRAGRGAVDKVQNPGDLMLVDPGLPFEGLSPDPVRLLVWDLAPDTLAPLLAAPEGGLRHIPRDGGVGAVLGTFARALMSQADRLDAVSQQSFRAHLCGLIALALGSSPIVRDSRNETYRTVRRQQILAYVEAHLHDCRMTVDRAARDLRMSPRWLHAIFDKNGTTFAAWVARRRIEECKKCLDDPAHDHLSVTDIAFRNGFNDLSTFSRQFRRHHGMTALEARRSRTLTRVT
jgi:AraC-like DNA-binding protein